MLDEYDRALLGLMQESNLRTHAELAEAVHLSPSAVRRRLKALRDRGVIRADVSIVEPGEGVMTFIVLVSFHEESQEGYARFMERMQASKAVAQCYYVAGEVDFVLIVHARNMESYREWGEELLLADPAIRRYDTLPVWRRVKNVTALPEEFLE